MAGVAGQPWVADSFHGGMGLETGGQPGRVGLGALQAHGERADPAQRQPGLERSGDGAVQRAPAGEGLGQVGLARHDGTEDHVGVPR